MLHDDPADAGAPLEDEIEPDTASAGDHEPQAKRHRSDKVTAATKKVEEKRLQVEKEAALVLRLQTASAPKRGARQQLDKAKARHEKYGEHLAALEKELQDAIKAAADKAAADEIKKQAAAAKAEENKAISEAALIAIVETRVKFQEAARAREGDGAELQGAVSFEPVHPLGAPDPVRVRTLVGRALLLKGMKGAYMTQFCCRSQPPRSTMTLSSTLLTSVMCVGGRVSRTGIRPPEEIFGACACACACACASKSASACA